MLFMPSKNPTQRLTDILENIQAIADFIADLTFEHYVSDRKTVCAVTRTLEIISEASRRLPDELKHHQLVLVQCAPLARSMRKLRLGRFCWHGLTGMAAEVCHDFGVHLFYLGQVATRHIAEVHGRFDLPHVRDQAAEESEARRDPSQSREGARSR